MVTPDGLEVDTTMSGFTVSPHEECAVEEAVQITERLGGSVTVLTLGPPEAAGQLRDMLALGASRGILLQTDGTEWGPIATAAAIAEAVGGGGPAATTCCCSATRRPTPAAIRCPCGWRTRSACPARPGSRGLRCRGRRPPERIGQPRVSRHRGGIRPAASRRGQRQGRDQPAALPVAARPAAGQARHHRDASSRAGSRTGCARSGCGSRKGQRRRAQCSAPGTEAVPGLVSLLDELGVLS